MRKTSKHEDTSISLHGMTFDEALAMLVSVPKRADSEAEASGKTTLPAPESGQAEPQTDPRRESSDD